MTAPARRRARRTLFEPLESRLLLSATPTIVGTEFDDNDLTQPAIYGTLGNDIIDALAGDDIVYADEGAGAGGGNDVVMGGDGLDVLYGEDGDDVLDPGAASQAGADTVRGGNGTDTLALAGSPREYLFGFATSGLATVTSIPATGPGSGVNAEFEGIERVAFGVTALELAAGDTSLAVVDVAALYAGSSNDGVGQPPIALSDTIGAARGATQLLIDLRDLLGNDYDPDGGAQDLTGLDVTAGAGIRNVDVLLDDISIGNAGFDAAVYPFGLLVVNFASPLTSTVTLQYRTQLTQQGTVITDRSSEATVTIAPVLPPSGQAVDDALRGTIGGQDLVLASVLLDNDNDIGLGPLTLVGLVGMRPDPNQPGYFVLDVFDPGNGALDGQLRFEVETSDPAFSRIRYANVDNGFGTFDDQFTFTYRAEDANGAIYTADVTVTVDNKKAVAVDQTVLVTPGVATRIQLADIVNGTGNSDPDGDPITLASYGFLDPAVGRLQGFGPVDQFDPNDFGSIEVTLNPGVTSASIRYGILDMPDLGGGVPDGQNIANATLNFVTLPPPLISLSAEAVNNAEGTGPAAPGAFDGVFAYTLLRSGDTSAATTVRVAIAGGSATNADIAAIEGAVREDGGSDPFGTWLVTFAVGEAVKEGLVIRSSRDSSVEPDEDFTVTLLDGPGYLRNTAQITATTSIIRNDDVPPVVEVAGLALDAEGTAPGDGGRVSFRIFRTGDFSQEISVNWTLAGSGTNPAEAADLPPGTLLTGTATIVANASDTFVDLRVTPDALDEPDEALTLTISDPVGATLGPNAAATVTILDDDEPLPLVGFAATDQGSVPEGSPGAGPAGFLPFAIQRSGDLSAATTLRFAVVGDDVAAADFIIANAVFAEAGPPGSLGVYEVTINAGEMGVSLFVQPVADRTPEADETVRLVLTGVVSNGVLSGITEASGVIANDDVPPTLAFRDLDVGSKVEGTPGGAPGDRLLFVLERSGDLAAPTVVTFELGGTAEAADIAVISTITGGSIAPVPGEPGWFTLAFDAGAAAAEIEALIARDTLDEADETVTITLLSAADGTLPAAGQRVATGTILDDDVPNRAPAASDLALTADEDFPAQLFSLAGLTTDDDATAWAIDNVVGGTLTGFDPTSGFGAFAPTADFSGQARIDWTVTDAGGLSDSASIIIEIAPLNDAPRDIALSNAAVLENQPVGTLVGLLSASDPDAGDSLTFAFAPGGNFQGLFALVDNELRTAAVLDFEAEVPFPIALRVTDAAGSTYDEFFAVAVGDVAPEAPTAQDVTADVLEDSTGYVFSLRSFSFDPDNDIVGFTITPVSGTILTSFDPTTGFGTYVFVPDFNGTAILDWTVTDATGLSDSATITVNVAPVNDAPDAIDDSVTTTFGTPVIIDALANDSDVDGDALIVTSVSSFGARGTATIVSGGNVTFTPEAGFVGTTSFTYAISDGVLFDTATVTINVAPPPEVGIFAPTLALEGTPPGLGGVLSFLVGRIGDATGTTTVTYTLGAGPGGVIATASSDDIVGGFGPRDVTFAPGETLKTVEIEIAPDALFEPEESLTATVTGVTNGFVGADSSVELIIFDDDDPPPPVVELVLAVGFTLEFSSANGQPGGYGLLLQRAGDLSAPTTVFWSLGPGVTPSFQGSRAAQPEDVVGGFGDFSLTFAAGQSEEYISVTFVDDLLSEPTEYFAITLNSVTNGIFGPRALIQPTLLGEIDDNEPVIHRFVGGTNGAEGTAPGSGGALTFRVAREGRLSEQTLTYSIGGTGSPGSASADDVVGGFGIRTVTFAEGEAEKVIDVALVADAAVEPDEGIAIVLLSAADPIPFLDRPSPLIGTPAGGTLTILNDDATPLPPVAVNDAYTFVEDDAWQAFRALPVTLNDSSPNGTPLTLTAATVPAGVPAGASVVGNDIWFFVSQLDWTTSFDIVYTITDGLQFASAVATISFTPVNDAPVGVDDAVQTAFDTPVTFNIIANDRDAENDPLVAGGYALPPNGTLSLNNELVTYTPRAGFFGRDTFTYRPFDGQLQGDPTTVVVDVAPRSNSAPDAVDDAYSVRAGQVLTIAAPGLLANDTDADGDALGVIELDLVGTNGELLPFPDGSFTFTPTPGFIGLTSFGYTITDGVASDTATVTLLVTPATEIVGTPGADRLIGTPQGDYIRALGGNDIVRARDGNDLVLGGPDDDRLYGGRGDDVLYGGLGSDVLDGGPGNDVLDGDTEPGSGPDTFVVDPSTGSDIIRHFKGSEDSLRIIGFTGAAGSLQTAAFGDGSVRLLDGAGNVLATFEAPFLEGAATPVEAINAFLAAAAADGRLDLVNDAPVFTSAAPTTFVLPRLASGAAADGVFQAQGALGEDTTLSFDWTVRKAAFRNEMGIFRVDDVYGAIGDLMPGDAGYAMAALSRGTVLFASGQGAGASASVEGEGGAYYALYLVQNATTADVLARNPLNLRDARPLAFFSVVDANPDAEDHLRAGSDGSGLLTMRWEDLAGGGDGDFDDAALAVRGLATATAPAFAYDASALDPEDDPVVYTLVEGPASASIDADSGRLVWATPVAGTHRFLIRAADPYGASADQAFELRVEETLRVLRIIGTDRNDRIYVSERDGVVRVRINDAVRAHSAVSGIYIDAGAGNDQVALRDLTVDAAVDGGAGNDRLDAADAMLARVELRGGDGNDDLRGGAQSDRLIGGRGNDVIRGGGGDDWIEGGEGIDALFGDNGDDVLLGGLGVDVALGGAGDDVLGRTDRGDVQAGQAGSDRIVDEAAFLANPSTWPLPAAGAGPVIDWSALASPVGHAWTGAGKAWLQDFVGQLGQQRAERNPNARLVIRI